MQGADGDNTTALPVEEVVSAGRQVFKLSVVPLHQPLSAVADTAVHESAACAAPSAAASKMILRIGISNVCPYGPCAWTKGRLAWTKGRLRGRSHSGRHQDVQKKHAVRLSKFTSNTP